METATSDADVLTELAPDVWVVSSPLSMFGLQLGTRMTVVRMADGGLWVHSPIELAPAIRAALDERGPVRHIVAPNLYHHLWAGSMAEAYPDAQVWGAAGLEKKRRDVTFAGMLGPDQAAPPWAEELAPYPVAGSLLGETVFHHASSRTLVSADLVENFEMCAHTPTRWYLKLSGIYGKPGFSHMLKPMFRDKALARASIDRLLDLELDRIVLAHGEPVESDATAVLRSTYTWLKG